MGSLTVKVKRRSRQQNLDFTLYQPYKRGTGPSLRLSLRDTGFLLVITSAS
jgi:hypothetical protein